MNSKIQRNNSNPIILLSLSTFVIIISTVFLFYLPPEVILPIFILAFPFLILAWSLYHTIISKIIHNIEINDRNITDKMISIAAVIFALIAGIMIQVLTIYVVFQE